MKHAYIYDAIRSPRTKAKETGGLHDITPQELLSQLYQHLEKRTQVDPNSIGEVILGCVTQSGEQAGNIAKTSTLYAGWPSSVSGLTVNRFCSSGLDAINLAALKINTGQEDTMIAGGVEMMSRVPMLSDKARVFSDPSFALQCKILMMGSGADLIASLNNISKEQADSIALLSHQRASHAQKNEFFKSIVPIENAAKGVTVIQDECIRPTTSMSSLAELPAAFEALGNQGVDALQLKANPRLEAIAHIHTAGNSPAMADAAAVLLLGDEALGSKIIQRPRAKIVAAATASADPLQVLSGCIAATKKLMQQQQLTAKDIDLFELHEAFAATVVQAQSELQIPIDKLNLNGGVIALGHPMGATGAIMAGMLIDELERSGKTLGLVSASGAGGSGCAILLQRMD